MEHSIEIYTSSDNQVMIAVTLENETVWLNRQQLSVLFDRDVKTIGKHINNIFDDGELEKSAVVANFEKTKKGGETFKVININNDEIIK